MGLKRKNMQKRGENCIFQRSSSDLGRGSVSWSSVRTREAESGGGRRSEARSDVKQSETKAGSESGWFGPKGGSPTRRQGSVRGQARTEGTVVNSNEQYFRFGSFFLAWFGSDLSSLHGSVRMNSTFGSAHEQYFRFRPS